MQPVRAEGPNHYAFLSYHIDRQHTLNCRYLLTVRRHQQPLYCTLQRAALKLSIRKWWVRPEHSLRKRTAAMEPGGRNRAIALGTNDIRAAQYVRMSTEHQRYSTLNQISAIHAYATQRGLHVVRTYTDAGRSGLELKSRPALKKLLQDVVSGRAEFSLILVYDVSRWGRFQDTDESAHYEFICRQAGVNVQYCAEQFVNDGSPMGALLKGMKRIMAAEFSRDLSVKTFIGQQRIASMGYRVGAAAGFGMRRLVVDEEGNQRAVLQTGQHKFVATDRTILIPGPPDEASVIRYMYRACAAGKTINEIASALNRRGKRTGRGNRWTSWTVGYILRNEKYAGILVWNKGSWKLRTEKVSNPKSEWVRVEGAFKPVVRPGLFDEARQAVRKRMAPTPEHVLLEGLRRLLDEKGHLTKDLIRADDRIPGPAAYQRQFGSVLEAYRRVGFKVRLTFGADADKKFAALNLENADKTAEALKQSGRSITFNRGQRSFVVGQGLTVQFMLLRCTRRPSGKYHWQLVPRAKPTVDILVAARMDHDNQCIHDYLILPRRDVRSGSIRMIDGTAHPFDDYRSNTLDPLYAIIARCQADGLSIGEQIEQAIAGRTTC